MKRVLALLLAAILTVTSLGVLTGCGNTSGNEDDLGAEIRAYLVGEIYDFDPAKAYTNDDAMKVLSLIYEPLFTLDSNGNIQYGLACGYNFYEYGGEYLLDIQLRNTMWNDGTPITAGDVVYSWKRILAHDFPCQAATLLYDIKNAKAVKLCDDKSVDDIGITDQDLTLTITFEKELDAEGQQNFLRNLTSIALTPVYEGAVSRGASGTNPGRQDYWAKRVSYIVTNGPFAIRAMDYATKEGDLVENGHEFRLERNPNYRRDAAATNAVDLYVTPYKFLSYWNQDLDEVFTEYIEGTTFIAGDIPLDKREEYLKSANITNMLSTYTYVLDNADPVFANAKVRRALSLVIDRAALVKDVTKGLGVPATGFVSHGVFNGAGGSFSAVTAAGESALASTADFETAVNLVKSAKQSDGYTGGSIRIRIRDNAEEKAIADAVVDAWKELFRQAGVSVSISVSEKSYTTFSVIEDDTSIRLYKDTVQEAYRVNDADTTAGFDGYNVLGIDYQMLSPDAFGALASFSYELSGNGTNTSQINSFEIRTHVCGFNNEDYNELIEQAYAEKNMAARTEILHDAEELLLAEMPVIPLLFNQSVTLVSGELQRVYTSYYGYNVLNRAELKNYHSHLIVEIGDEKTEE